MATIAVLGTFDTKGKEHAYLADHIKALGHSVLLIDFGTGGQPQVHPDIDRFEVGRLAGIDVSALVARKDRGVAVTAMAGAAAEVLAKLAAEGKIQGAIALGGGGGTSIAATGMRALPIGFPKVIVSTMASGQTAHYVGTKDIVLFPSIVDVNGLNRISKHLFSQAASAICGMVTATSDDGDQRPLIVASMFGNTTPCLNAAVPALEAKGFEVLVFHATGAGGRTMESLIESGMVQGVLDITTTELADELVGGVLTAGPDRCMATGRSNVPSIVAPGCLDMVNFGEPKSIPSKFDGRLFYVHNPQITLMRTTQEECRKLGKLLADKMNTYTAPTTLLLPLRGVSIISAEGGPFYDPHADQVLYDSLQEHLRKDIPVRSLDTTINDPQFANACVEELLKNVARFAGD